MNIIKKIERKGKYFKIVKERHFVNIGSKQFCWIFSSKSTSDVLLLMRKFSFFTSTFQVGFHFAFDNKWQQPFSDYADDVHARIQIKRFESVCDIHMDESNKVGSLLSRQVGIIVTRNHQHVYATQCYNKNHVQFISSCSLSADLRIFFFWELTVTSRYLYDLESIFNLQKKGEGDWCGEHT